jgi:hypothetical protein
MKQILIKKGKRNRTQTLNRLPMARDEGIITATYGEGAAPGGHGGADWQRKLRAACGPWSFGGGRMQSYSSSSCKVRPEQFRLPRRWKNMEVPRWEVPDHREERSFFHHHSLARPEPNAPSGLASLSGSWSGRRRPRPGQEDQVHAPIVSSATH